MIGPVTLPPDPPALLERLRERGYRLTAQRRVVAQVLEGENVHLTADEVHEQAVVLLPEISRATVYSTLQQLTDLGEVRELNFDGRSRRYDPNVSPVHHHLVCDRCGRVTDVAHGVDAPALDATEVAGMGTVVAAEITYHGRCLTCADAHDHDG